MRWTASLLLIFGASLACSDDSAVSCSAMRAELARMRATGHGTAWDDIQALQVGGDRAMRLVVEIGRRCATGGEPGLRQRR